jgi:aldehyde:ferredoxin oxidoreductase
MILKAKTIKDLQKIIKRDYGVEISKEDAQEFGGSLLRLTRLILNRQLEKQTKKTKA